MRDVADFLSMVAVLALVGATEANTVPSLRERMRMFASNFGWLPGVIVLLILQALVACSVSETYIRESGSVSASG